MIITTNNVSTNGTVYVTNNMVYSGVDTYHIHLWDR